MELSRGQKVPLKGNSLEVALSLSGPASYDLSCFGVDASEKLSDDRYFVFYNQTSSPEGAIKILGAAGNPVRFGLDLSRLPEKIQKLVFVATIEGAGNMRDLREGVLEIFSGSSLARFAFSGRDFQDEKAVMVAEIYRKGEWRLGAVGQGFSGGLSALLAHFGGEEVKEVEPVTGQPKVRLNKIELDKKMAQQAPQILNLAKKAEVSLAKRGLLDHQAQVALCLDISGSMSNLYSSGKIQRLAEKVLALGTRFDDNGAIDIFLFGQHAHEAGDMDIGNFARFVGEVLRRYPLEGATNYGAAMALMRQHYFGSASRRQGPYQDSLPVYILFLTDGSSTDPGRTREQLTWSSYEPMFFQFVAIGASKKDVRARRGGFFQKALASDFTFLEELDTLSGRFVDNANFFSVEDPEAIPDNELYELLMGEYPEWLKVARQKGLLPA